MTPRSVDDVDWAGWEPTIRATLLFVISGGQILLIRKLGRDLKTLVHKSIINYLLRLLRGPAHAAGFGNLQEFLETGLAAFRALEDPGHFVDTIYDREWAAMERLFAGDPDPFSFGAS